MGEAVELCLIWRTDLLKNLANTEDMTVERVNRGKDIDCEFHNRDVSKMFVFKFSIPEYIRT